MATVLGTAATGVWAGLPGDDALAAIAAVVVLLAATGIVAWVVLSGTAVVGYAAAVVWALAGIALNDPPPAVVVAGAIAIVVVLAATLAGSPPPAARCAPPGASPASPCGRPRRLSVPASGCGAGRPAGDYLVDVDR